HAAVDCVSATTGLVVNAPITGPSSRCSAFTRARQASSSATACSCRRRSRLERFSYSALAEAPATSGAGVSFDRSTGDGGGGGETVPPSQQETHCVCRAPGNQYAVVPAGSAVSHETQRSSRRSLSFLDMRLTYRAASRQPQPRWP